MRKSFVLFDMYTEINIPYRLMLVAITESQDVNRLRKVLSFYSMYLQHPDLYRKNRRWFFAQVYRIYRNPFNFADVEKFKDGLPSAGNLELLKSNRAKNILAQFNELDKMYRGRFLISDAKYTSDYVQFSPAYALRPFRK